MWEGTHADRDGRSQINSLQPRVLLFITWCERSAVFSHNNATSLHHVHALSTVATRYLSNHSQPQPQRSHTRSHNAHTLAHSRSRMLTLACYHNQLGPRKAPPPISTEETFTRQWWCGRCDNRVGTKSPHRCRRARTCCVSYLLKIASNKVSGLMKDL